VNSILLAQVLNPGLQQRIDADPLIKDRFLSGIPAGRFGSTNDITGLVVFLASDASSWITGAIIPINGGNLPMNAGGSVGSEGFSGIRQGTTTKGTTYTKGRRVGNK
jgi:hypothetical protein